MAILVLWQMIPTVEHTPAYLFPSLADVAQVFTSRLLDGSLLHALLITLQLLLEGMLVGALLALVFTGLAVLVPAVRDLLDIAVAIFNPVPAIALLPVALIWFGFSVTSVIFVIVMSVLWPMTINMLTGFTTIRPVTIQVGRNIGLRGGALFWHIYMPAALPHLIAGARIGWAFAWRTGIAAELVFGAAGSSGGLGWQIYVDRAYLQTAAVFSGLLMIVIVGLLVDNMLWRRIESMTIKRWGMVS